MRLVRLSVRSVIISARSVRIVGMVVLGVVMLIENWVISVCVRLSIMMLGLVSVKSVAIGVMNVREVKVIVNSVLLVVKEKNPLCVNARKDTLIMVMQHAKNVTPSA